MIEGVLQLHHFSRVNQSEYYKKIICIAFLEIILRTVSMEHITVTCFLRKKRKCVAEAEMICSVDAEIEIDEPSCQNQNKHPARLFTCCCYCPRTWQSTYVLLPTANPLRRRRILRWRAGLVFQRKKEAARRRLWVTRCKRGPTWKATRHHALCSNHFIDWNNGPSPSHPDPELFGYNQWRPKNNAGAISGLGARTPAADRGDQEPLTQSLPSSHSAPALPVNIDFIKETDEEVQTDVHIEVETWAHNASVQGMLLYHAVLVLIWTSFMVNLWHKFTSGLLYIRLGLLSLLEGLECRNRVRNNLLHEFCLGKLCYSINRCHVADLKTFTTCTYTDEWSNCLHFFTEA